MDEKTMVSDALVGINGELKMFGDMIPQTENKELKQCLKQIRNQCEMAQEKMYTAAREKSYYVPCLLYTSAVADISSGCGLLCVVERRLWDKGKILPDCSAAGNI